MEKLQTKITVVTMLVLGLTLAFALAQAQAYPTATASDYWPIGPPSNVVDYNNPDGWKTVWAMGSDGSQPPNVEWIYLDYGSPRTFDTVRILWGGDQYNDAYAKSFNVQISDDPNGTWTTLYSTTNGGKGLMMIPIGMTTSRYVRIECTEPGTRQPYYYAIAEISTHINYPYSSASSSASGYEEYKARDGDLDSGWRSSAGGSQSLTLTYEDTATFCFATIVWGDTYPTSYAVEVNDGNDWETVYSVTDGDGGVDDFWLEMEWVYDEGKDDYVPKPCHNVRLACTAGGASYEVREFRVSVGDQAPEAFASESWQNADWNSPDDSYTYCPGMATDGSLDAYYGRWASGNNAEHQWIYVDMGAEHTFDEMKIYWKADADCNDYTISGSIDGKTWTELAHLTSTTGDVDVITFTETTARFVKVQLDNLDWWPYSIREIYIVPGALATSCWSYEWGPQVPFKAVDGDLETAWCSLPPWGSWGTPPPNDVDINDQTITIDYGVDGTTIDTVILHWTDWFAKSYSIDTSDTLDGSWSSIYSTTQGNGGTDVIVLASAIDVNYMRVHCTERGDETVGYALKEIEAVMRTRMSDIDYGSPKTFNTVHIVWNQLDNGQDFRIQTSNDASSWTIRYSSDNGGEGLMLLPIEKITARYVRIQHYESSSWNNCWSYMIAETSTYLEYPYGEASSSASGYETHKAKDGDLATGWRSSAGGTQSYTLTYENPTKLCFATIIWGDTYATSYTVEVNDGNEWSTGYSTTEGDGGIDDIWLDVGWHDPNIYDNDWNYVSTPQLKVRLICTAGGASYEVREFRVSLGNQYPQAYASEAWKNADMFDNLDKRWQYCPGFLVNGGIDGDYSRWATGNYVKYQDICIDMGSEQTFDEMKIYWQPNADCNDYTISGSTNGKTWSQLAHQTSTTGDVDVITFTEATARFVKLELENIVDRPYSIKELYIIPGALATSCRADEWGSQTPFRAVDGDVTTGWSSVPPWGNWGWVPSDSVLNDQSITIDYGQNEVSFNTVIMHWGGWFARSYSIDVADNVDGPWTTKHSTTIGDGSTDLVLLDEDITTQFLRVHCTKRGNTAVSYALDEVVLESRIRYPVATASSYLGGNVPANAIDDSDTTRWESAHADPQWIQIDYGQLKQFDKVLLYWEGAYGKSYQIQTSNDGSSWTPRYTTTTGDGGNDVIDLGGVITARYVRMHGTERGTSYGYSLYDFSPQLSSPPVKLAALYTNSLTAVGAVAKSYQGGYPASNAIDGSDTTRWASNWSDDEWIRIDLGESKQFNHVRLYWETAYGKSYEIQTSDDDSNWTTRYSTTKGMGGDETVRLNEIVTARYVRMNGTKRGTPWGYSLYDFRAIYAPPGKQLLVNGQPFIMKGVCYGGTPVGMNYHYSWSGDADMYNIDLPLLQDIGCNVIRLYQPPLYSDGMDAAYEKGLYAMMGYDIAQDSNILDPNVRNAFKSHFVEMVEQWKDHPAVLMWAIANEMNAHLWVVDANGEEDKEATAALKQSWYELVDECAAAAKQIEGSNYHPVTTVGVETGDIENNHIFGCADSNMPHLDIWSVNVYRGDYFYDLFALNKYASCTGKPMCIAEFGCDVYHTLEERVFETPQAEYMKNWWVEMLGNSSALNPDKPCIGGTLFQYADDWNKQGDASGHALWPTGGCWNLYDSVWDPEIWNLKPNWEDEWVGIVGIAPDTYEKTIREAYYSLGEVWAASDDVVSDNFATDTQANYTWYGSEHSHDGTNEWINTYAGTGSDSYVTMTRSFSANEVAMQADFKFTNTTGANGAICAFVRATAGSEPGTQDSYCAIIDVNDGGALHPSLYRTNGGVWQELVSDDGYRLPGLNEWHTIRFAANDNILTLFISGHKVFNYTDNSGQAITAAGNVAIKTIDGDAYIDNFFAIKCGFGGDDTYADLVGLWKFDENGGGTTADSSGNGNTGTLSGGTTWTTGYYGDSAVYFNNMDAAADWVEVPYNPSLDVNKVTIAAWVSVETEACSNQTIAKRDGSYRLWLMEEENSLCASVWVGGTRYQLSSWTRIFKYGDWAHAAMTYDGTHIKIYRDGLLISSGNVCTGNIDEGTGYMWSSTGTWEGGKIDSSSSPLMIGSEGVWYYGIEKGAVDELYIYGNALTQQQIKDVADNTPPQCSIVINNGDEIASSRDVVLTLSAEDPETTVVEMRFANDSISDENWSAWVPYATTHNWTLSDGTGEKKVYVMFKNGVGQQSFAYLDTIELISVGFDDNFDDGNADGWDVSGLWHVTGYRNNSPSYSLAYNQESTHNYDTGSANSGGAITPFISVGTEGTPMLSFWSWYQTESTGAYWDYKKVYISTDGGSSWTQICQISGTDSYQQWYRYEVDLSAYAGETVKLKFEFNTIDHILNNYEGWYIDDVTVELISSGGFDDNFDDGNADGWDVSGLWHVTDYKQNSPLYSLAYNQESTHNYDTGSANSGSAITPSINVGTDTPMLSFWSWYRTESTGIYWDYKKVYISTDGGSSWTQICQVSGTDSYQQWYKYEINLSAYAGMSVKLKFEFNTIDHILNNYEGWYIDDIAVFDATVFKDDFSDNNYTENPVWDVYNGAWSASSGYLDASTNFFSQDIRSEEISVSSASRVVIEYDTMIRHYWANYNLIALSDSSGTTLINAGIFFDNYNGRGGGLYIYDGANTHYKTGQSVATDQWKHVKITFENGNITVDYDNGAITFTKPSVYSTLEDIKTVRINGWTHRYGARYDNIEINAFD